MNYRTVLQLRGAYVGFYFDILYRNYDRNNSLVSPSLTPTRDADKPRKPNFHINFCSVKKQPADVAFVLPHQVIQLEQNIDEISFSCHLPPEGG